MLDGSTGGRGGGGGGGGFLPGLFHVTTQHTLLREVLGEMRALTISPPPPPFFFLNRFLKLSLFLLVSQFLLFYGSKIKFVLEPKRR